MLSRLSVGKIFRSERLAVVIGFCIASVYLLYVYQTSRHTTQAQPQQRSLTIPSPTATPILTPTATPTPLPTPTPTPIPFSELNRLYGPCAIVPTLMYHHVQQLDLAKEKGYASLTVDPGNFQKQLQYIKDHGYTPIRVEQLNAFFDAATPLPTKPILLTFDDGYDDFGSVAAPMLRQFGFPAVSFVPTGLLDNPGYMTWSTVTDIASWGIIYFANHTWSHHNVSASLSEDEREITTADTQLSQKNLNASKVFAYPYGNPSANGQTVLSALRYTLSFTTAPGSTQCRGYRYTLPRIRIGNANLSYYGL